MHRRLVMQTLAIPSALRRPRHQLSRLRPYSPVRCAPAPAARAPAPAASDFAPAVGDDELLERGGDLLRRVEAQRRAVEGKLKAETTSQLRWAERQLRTDPTGRGRTLKSHLANIETMPDIDPQLRQELESQVRSAIQFASRREAQHIEALAKIEQRNEAATSAARLLEETFRRETTLKTLSRQLNALIDEGRYSRGGRRGFAEVRKDRRRHDHARLGRRPAFHRRNVDVAGLRS